MIKQAQELNAQTIKRFQFNIIQSPALDPMIADIYLKNLSKWWKAAKLPKREDIKSILIIGAGPIVIGQACEFDYSGTQATQALKQEGYRIILVNSNPATIMTDPNLADATYICLLYTSDAADE